MPTTMQITTPKGELQWATINGQGKLDYNGTKYQYTIDVVCDEETAQPLVDQLDAFWSENKPKNVKEPRSTGYKVLEDGSVKFTLKTSTVYPSGDQKEIKVYDAKAQQVKLDDKIGNGSIGRASGAAGLYVSGRDAGVTLYLDAVQVIKLIRYVGAASGFEADDEGDFDGAQDGFVAEELV